MNLKPRNVILYAVFLSLLGSAAAQQLRVQSSAAVVNGQGRWFPWYEVQADPTDPAHLMVCGSRFDNDANTITGFVYSSADNGSTWRLALEDKTSDYVAEASCAFGLRGTAYFIVSAAIMKDGEIVEPQLGAAHIYESHDWGNSWRLRAKTRWADYSASIVNTLPGTHQNQLLTFFHDYHNAKKPPSTVAVLTATPGSNVLRRPISNLDRMYWSNGAYPRKVVVLSDGSILCFYREGIDSPTGRALAVSAVIFEPRSQSLSRHMIVVQVIGGSDRSCPLGDAEDYHVNEDHLVVAYHEFLEGRCRFMLTDSRDRGKSWSEAVEIHVPNQQREEFADPALAFNSAGFLGLLWRETSSSNCWLFSISAKTGTSFGTALPLSDGCSVNNPANPILSSSWMQTAVLQSSALHGRLYPNINLLNRQNAVFGGFNGLVGTSDGMFHAVWAEESDRVGQLYSAVIGGPDNYLRETVSAIPRSLSVSDISKDVAVLYGGEQNYDPLTSNITLSLIVRNRTKRALGGPLFIEVATLTSQFGSLEVANANNELKGPGARWKIPGASLFLAPQAVAGPCQLVFHLSLNNRTVPTSASKMISLQLKILGAQ